MVESIASPNYHQGSNECQHNNNSTYTSGYPTPPDPRTPRHQKRATGMHRPRVQWRYQALHRRSYEGIAMLKRVHLERIIISRAHLTRPQRQRSPASLILLCFHQPPTNKPTPRRDEPKPKQRPSSVGFLRLLGPFIAGIACARALCVRA